jgi:hypothetical protein
LQNDLNTEVEKNNKLNLKIKNIESEKNKLIQGWNDLKSTLN